jgi:O-antigen/teichoic acid export membrane protein
MVAQLWQAAGSFGLQILAAHLLGATGLGSFALCFGVIVLSTALISGVVGDSLTVLDRRDPGVRAALQWWAMVLVVASSVVGPVALHVSGMLTLPQALVFGVASALFQVEEILRRLFMAELRFWRLVVIDTTALLGAVATVAVGAWMGPISLTTLLIGLAAGQALASGVALAMLPAPERRLVSLRRPDVRAVTSFGVWRGAQVAVNPAVLTAFRSVLIFAAGTAALGEVEAARILVAPAILLVQGLGSYLLASYARDAAAPLHVLAHRANRAALVMSTAIVVAGGAAALLVPYAGRFVTGPDFAISALAVFCWALYAASSATMQPYASLCAARGRPRQVFTVRLVDSTLGLSLAAVAVLVLHVPATVSPVALAIGLLCGGALVRTLVLRPLLHQAERSTPHAAEQLFAASTARSQVVTR